MLLPWHLQGICLAPGGYVTLTERALPGEVLELEVGRCVSGAQLWPCIIAWVGAYTPPLEQPIPASSQCDADPQSKQHLIVLGHSCLWLHR
jgi:hypothetical protein